MSYLGNQAQKGAVLGGLAVFGWVVRILFFGGVAIVASVLVTLWAAYRALRGQLSRQGIVLLVAGTAMMIGASGGFYLLFLHDRGGVLVGVAFVTYAIGALGTFFAGRATKSAGDAIGDDPWSEIADFDRQVGLETLYKIPSSGWPSMPGFREGTR